MSRAPGRVWPLLRRDGRARIGLVVVLVLVLAAALAPLLARHDPTAIDLAAALRAPSGAHWLGTDVQGRDVWSRLVHGARVSLAVGVLSQVISLLIGVALGLVAGYYGRRVDDLVMRLADVTLAFPTLLLLIAMAAAFEPSLTTVFVTIGVVGWAGMARLVRGQVLVVRHMEYVQAERALGASDARILVRHVLPNVIAPVVIAPATPSVAAMTTGAMTLGRTCRSMMRRSPAPSARSACTYSSCRTTSTWPRTSRAIPAQPTTPIVTNTVVSDGSNAAAIAMSSSSVGKASVTSASRITRSSTRRP